ncbi:hypothetical protein KDN24_05465 [Bacillus sp. Bva_UNVM-123]|uniref:hypothetical protein n=1 Tax=Bacillus sp. Bva_UNVM-123 TaxID=2829798 RepID=UPI00391F0B12
MCLINAENVAINQLQEYTEKTAFYLLDAIREQDYESANLEMEELKFLMKRLEDMRAKQKRFQMLKNVVTEMKARGIKIDFAKRALFLKNNAKNAVEIYEKTNEIHKLNKKRQQA